MKTDLLLFILVLLPSLGRSESPPRGSVPLYPVPTISPLEKGKINNGLPFSLTTNPLLNSMIRKIKVVSGPTSSGGGGNLCYLDKPELLELQGLATFENPGTKIPESNEMLSPIKPLEDPLLLKRINEILKPLRTSYPLVAEVLDFGIKNDWYMTVAERFSTPVEAYLPENHPVCNEKNVRAAIVMIDGMKFVSRPAWNELDLDTQAYLVIHEGWRFAQRALDLPIHNGHLQALTYYTVLFPEFLNSSEDLREILLKFLFLEPEINKRACELLNEAKTNSQTGASFLVPLEQICADPLKISSEILVGPTAELRKLFIRNPELTQDALMKVLRFYSGTNRRLTLLDLSFKKDRLVLGGLNLGLTWTHIPEDKRVEFLKSHGMSSVDVQALEAALKNLIQPFLQK
ncbi:MAG: hypothetical protein AB7O96_09145 [Pseudobdellovibrionaceae bacterium]